MLRMAQVHVIRYKVLAEGGAWGHIFILGVCPTVEGEYTFRSANSACLPSFHYSTGADNLPAR